MKVVKALAILLLGPPAGVLVAFVAAAVALPPDPNFLPNSEHVAPGDGFLVLGFVFVSLLVSLPLSIGFAWRVLFGKPKGEG